MEGMDFYFHRTWQRCRLAAACLHVKRLTLKCNIIPGPVNALGAELVVSQRHNDRYLQVENKQAEPALMDVPTELSRRWHRFHSLAHRSACVSVALCADSRVILLIFNNADTTAWISLLVFPGSFLFPPTPGFSHHGGKTNTCIKCSISITKPSFSTHIKGYHGVWEETTVH